MNPLLDFGKEFDIKILESLVADAFNPNSPRKNEAEELLIQFKENPNAWTRVDQILKQGTMTETQFFALQILEHTVKTRWLIFSREQRQGLRTYVIQYILEASAQKETFILNKFNIVLVEILKKEWPQDWPTFISDLVQASQTISMDVCRNSLNILRRLNEEIFIYSKNMTTIRKKYLQDQLKTEYVQIFQLIKNILEYSLSMNLDEKLLKSTFLAFKSFCKWMGRDFLFESNIVPLIITYLESKYSLESFSCLREIVENTTNNSDSTSEVLESKQMTNDPKMLALINEKLSLIHTNVVKFLKMYFAEFKKEKVSDAYPKLDTNEKELIRESSFLLTAFYENNLHFLERSNQSELIEGLKILCEFSKIRDIGIFMRNHEFWNYFVYDLYSEFPFNKPARRLLRRDKYVRVLECLVNILVLRMPRPEEVFITQNEYGEIIKEKMVEVEKIDHYKKMKETLFHLSFLTSSYIKQYFASKFSRFLAGEDFTYENLNHICWSIGCISESFSEEEERAFFVDIIKDLLALCEMRQSKADKAVIASNIMYIIGQYHRFLLTHHAFLKVLVRKLIEFMHESHEGIKDMACDTLLRITEKCSVHFDKIIAENKVSMTLFMLANLKEITGDLEFYQKRIVYEAMVLMIITASENNQMHYLDILCRSFSTTNFMTEAFIDEKLIELGQGNTEQNILMCKELSHTIKSYSLLYEKMPNATIVSYDGILRFLILIYEKCGQINNNMANLIKNDIVQLFINVMKAKTCTEEFSNIIFERIIFDFKNNAHKDPHVLILGAEMVKSIQFNAEKESFLINSLIIPSISILASDPDENTELSMAYFTLVENFITFRFQSFFPIIFQMEIFNSFFVLILTGASCIKDISEKSLKILNCLLKNLIITKNFLFFKTQYFVVIENILGVIFDKDKTYNFELQSETLGFLIQISHELPPFDMNMDNKFAVLNYIQQLLQSSFNNLTKEAIEVFTVGLFDLCCDKELFRDHLLDFRVKIYEFGSNEDLQSDVAMMQMRSGMARRG